MDETVEDEGTPTTVGEQLREAREAKGLSLEDVAASTRIPTRHLISLEAGAWDKLPAPTYAVGFAKNYAGAVGLDRVAIGDQLRSEMGGVRPAQVAPIEYLEVADPKRSFPKGLVFGALALLVLAVVALVWVNERQLRADAPANEATTNEVAAAPAATAPTAPTATQPVTLSATEDVWLEIKDGGAILKQGEMKAGETYQIPASAVAPVLMTGKPEALRITVGNSVTPPVGEAGKRVKDVSLKGGDLLAPSSTAPAATAPATAAPAPASRPASRPTQRRSTPPAAPGPSDATATNAATPTNPPAGNSSDGN